MLPLYSFIHDLFDTCIIAYSTVNSLDTFHSHSYTWKHACSTFATYVKATCSCLLRRRYLQLILPLRAVTPTKVVCPHAESHYISLTVYESYRYSNCIEKSCSSTSLVRNFRLKLLEIVPMQAITLFKGINCLASYHLTTSQVKIPWERIYQLGRVQICT